MRQQHREMQAIERFLLCNERPICYLGPSGFNLIGLEGLLGGLHSVLWRDGFEPGYVEDQIAREEEPWP